MSVAAVVVTHNADRWLPALLASIDAQSCPVDRLVVVDDGSTDGTVEILGDRGITPLRAQTTATDVFTRVAANFVQGVRAADSDVVVLGDHDDVWHPERVAHQLAALGDGDLMVASDGRLVDGAGTAVGATLRGTFAIPDGWDSLDAAARMRAVLRRVVATGGASALRPGSFPTLDVPAGWLHDRWWSLVAAARGGLVLDGAVVIDYRLTDDQQVGLDLGAQHRSPLRRLGTLATAARLSWRKQRDLRVVLRPLARDEQLASAITLRHVLGG